MTTIDYLPNDILKEIFKKAPHHTMIIRTVCRRWQTLAPTYRTTLAALHWRDVNFMPVPDKPTFVELSVDYKLKNNVRYYCKIKSELICQYAAKYGYLEILKSARANGCHWDKYTCSFAAESGQLDVLKWARANGCPWDKWTCACAAEGGYLEILKWARSNGCPLDKWTCAYAAGGGQLEVLKWARANGCPWDEWTCIYAAGNGYPEVLKWARANGCPWDEDTCTYAAEGGHLEVLKWARANGCPWDYKFVHDSAVKSDQQHILKWLAAQN